MQHKKSAPNLVQVFIEGSLLLEREALHVNAEGVLVMMVEVLKEALHQAINEVHWMDLKDQEGYDISMTAIKSGMTVLTSVDNLCIQVPLGQDTVLGGGVSDRAHSGL